MKEEELYDRLKDSENTKKLYDEYISKDVTYEEWLRRLWVPMVLWSIKYVNEAMEPEEA